MMEMTASNKEDATKMEGASPARLLEMLSDRFGALKAVAYSSIKLSRHQRVARDVDVHVLEAVLPRPPHARRRPADVRLRPGA
jgi:hypothetical protein